jgi:hypothetical protein
MKRGVKDSNLKGAKARFATSSSESFKFKVPTLQSCMKIRGKPIGTVVF